MAVGSLSGMMSHQGRLVVVVVEAGAEDLGRESVSRCVYTLEVPVGNSVDHLIGRSVTRKDTGRVVS